MLDRHHLKIVREVDRQGTLTGAARQLHLTQPALTHAIRKLEGQLGVRLWRKEGRRLRLTQAGCSLLDAANRLLPQLEYAEERLRQFATGQRGALRIGMECHPCYQWLLKVVAPYLHEWPDVEVDVKQRFQFGGIGALFGDEIDLLITPDPLHKPGLSFTPVFDYELVLVAGLDHPFVTSGVGDARQLADQVLIAYPVPIGRLDIYNRFLTPANCAPKKHKVIETTDIMLQMVAAGRGVAALPDWLVAEYAKYLPVAAVKIGRDGIHKHIFVGCRSRDAKIDYLQSFVDMATIARV